MEHSLPELLERCAHKDPLAQRDLFDLLNGKVMGICCRYSSSQDEAEDIFQESMIKVFRQIEQKATVDNFFAWASRLTINTAIDHYHQRKSEALVDLEEARDVHFSENDAHNLDRMSADEIIELLSILPQNQRIVFNLHMVEGFSHREIAGKLNLAESSSRVLLTRAKRKLISVLKKNEVHEKIFG